VRALVFGQSGLQKDQYLREVKAIAQSNGRDFEIINLGDWMHRIDAGKRDPQLYPSLPVYERETMRNEALKAVKKEFSDNPHRDYVLNAHAVFKLDTGLIPASDAELLSEMQPDLIVVVLDDFHYIYRRLRGTAFEDLSHAAILEWRDAEINAAKTIAHQLYQAAVDESHGSDWRFYVVARGHHPRVIYRLFYEREERVRIYSSFAITGASPEQKAKIRSFKERLGEKHIVFDPFKVTERGMIALADSLIEEMAERCRENKKVQVAYRGLIRALGAAGARHENVFLRSEFRPEEVFPGLADLVFKSSESDRAEREDQVEPQLFQEYRFPLEELQSLRSTVDGQIISRDYLLIDQSLVVCALIPWNPQTGKPEISAGSQSELTYARLTGKKRFVVWEGPKNKLSPWVEKHATELFKSLEALEKRLESKI